MAKGAIAKEEVVKKISEAFGSSFIGEFDKKVYVWANDGGEQVQIAISLTCPKNPIQVDASVSLDDGDLDFTDDTPKTSKVAVSAAPPAEITDEEKKNIAELMAVIICNLSKVLVEKQEYSVVLFVDDKTVNVVKSLHNVFVLSCCFLLVQRQRIFSGIPRKVRFIFVLLRKQTQNTSFCNPYVSFVVLHITHITSYMNKGE